MMDALPIGWVNEKLLEIATSKKGKKPEVLRNDPAKGFVPYLDIHAIEKKEIRQYADVKSSRISDKNDLLVVWDGARSGWIGRGAVGAIGSTIAALKSDVVLPDYLYYFIKSRFKTINSNTRGTGIPHVDPEIFWEIEVPLPPLNEQHRIVEKLDQLIAKVESSKKRLDKFPQRLKRFRQSVLAAACSGKLTENWREENKVEEWDKSTVVQIAERIQIGPFGTQLHKSDYVSNGIPLINPMHIKDYRIVADNEYSITKKKYAELKNYHLKTNDIIMARRGEMGRCALVTENENAWLCGTGSLFVRANRNVYPRFLFFVLSSAETKEFLEGESKGTTMSNLNLDILNRIPISLPSFTEQQEIVRRVEALFALADQLEARYKKAQSYVEKLTQSILAKAFRGELVPQDPNDEPASVLLERIKAEREKKLSEEKPAKQKNIRPRKVILKKPIAGKSKKVVKGYRRRK
ncbi:MAG: restriction endonuclease subunit S [Bacteroidota bacterium]|jgi:type I restriction enzyme S subunit